MKKSILLAVLILLLILVQSCARRDTVPESSPPHITEETITPDEEKITSPDATPEDIDSSTTTIKLEPTGSFDTPALPAGEDDNLALQGKKFLEEANYEQAMRSLNKAIVNDPNDAKALAYRGKAYFEMNEYQKSQEDLDKSITIDNKNWEAYLYRGILRENVMDKSAIDDFNKAIELNPNSAEAYYRRGCVLELQGENETASADFKKALELDPDGDIGRLVRDIIKR